MYTKDYVKIYVAQDNMGQLKIDRIEYHNDRKDIECKDNGEYHHDHHWGELKSKEAQMQYVIRAEIDEYNYELEDELNK